MITTLLLIFASISDILAVGDLGTIIFCILGLLATLTLFGYGIVEHLKSRRSQRTTGSFSIVVTSVRDWDGFTMVAGILKKGQQPQKGNKFRVSRTGKVGTIEDSTSLGQTFNAAMQAGASVSIIGSGNTLNSQVAFRISDMGLDDIQNGDEIVSC